MPPSAFQKKKVRNGMWFMPAIHAAVTRTSAIQRPRKTASGRAGEEAVAVMRSARCGGGGTGRAATSARRRPALRPIQ